MVRYGMESEEDIQELPAPEMKQAEEPGKVRLILDKGWRIGKKIAITGAAISTAPIVLPPLMIFSALGLVFSVPFGLVFAGYACTDKIMRSLLPPPPMPDAIASASPEEEPYMKALSEEMKQEAVHITEIYEGGEGGLGYEEDERMVRGEKKQQAVGTDEGVPLVKKEEDVKVEENDGDVNKEEKGQEGEVIVKEITKNDDRIRDVAGETRKAEDVPEAEKQDAGEKKVEELRKCEKEIMR